MLRKFLFFITVSVLISVEMTAIAASTARTVNSGQKTTGRASDYISANTYNNAYPYMNNSMRTQLNSGQTPNQTNAQTNVMTRTKSTSSGTSARRVVARSAVGGASASGARSATNSKTSATSARRVVARTASNGGGRIRSAGTRTSGARAVVARSDRGDLSTYSTQAQLTTNPYSMAGTVSSSRCLADYTECMDGYCKREDTAYNRCYCSAKLAQIDSTYKTSISNLITQIAQLQGANTWTDEEMQEYWESTMGQYTDTNSWKNIDEALNIDWASMESRVRGQQAFASGHEYCVQYLANCYYMASNLRDAYRSEIARDCATYETSLQKLQSVAESVVEAYK